MPPARFGLGLALLSACVLLLLGLAGCGDAARGTDSSPTGPASNRGDNSTEAATTTDEAAASGSFNALVKLCEVTELNEKASALYPEQHIRCFPGTGTPTPSHQVSSAAWTAGEVDPSTNGIADEHTIQAVIEGNKPNRETRAPQLIYDNECPPPTEGVQCEDRELKIEGTHCLMRKQVLEVGGPTITGWQVGCYLGRDSKTGLDVGVTTAATKLDSAQGIEDFTAAAIQAVRGG